MFTGKQFILQDEDCCQLAEEGCLQQSWSVSERVAFKEENAHWGQDHIPESGLFPGCPPRSHSMQLQELQSVSHCPLTTPAHPDHCCSGRTWRTCEACQRWLASRRLKADSEEMYGQHEAGIAMTKSGKRCCCLLWQAIGLQGTVQRQKRIISSLLCKIRSTATLCAGRNTEQSELVCFCS